MQPRFFQIIEGIIKGQKNRRSKRVRSNALYYSFFLIVGVVMIVRGIFSPKLGVLPFIGFFFILFWMILTAREYHEKFDDLRREYIIKWMNDEKIAVDKKRVVIYTALSLLPLYFLMALPCMVVLIVGELMAWLMVGAAGTIFTFVAMFAFSATWKELYLKLRYFWLMQLSAFVLINGVGLLCFRLFVF